MPPIECTAIAHPNIALVKYWGKRDTRLNLPLAGSLSLTLSGLSTTTRVAFDEELRQDHITLDEKILTKGRARQRICAFLDIVRNAANNDTRAIVETRNDFPTASGLASSASGFAALATAASAAAGLHCSHQKLSAMARRGSGSAARSIFGGFVEMHPGQNPDGSDAHASTISNADHWDLHCLIAITARGEKKISSTEAMHRTLHTSPLFPAWIRTIDEDLQTARDAIKNRDFDALATVTERNCLRMHATALSAEPGILYWNPTTVAILHLVRDARQQDLPVFFTIDAGPHVKLFCPPDALDPLRSLLASIPGIRELILARPGPGAHLLSCS